MSLNTNTIGGALWINFINTYRYSNGEVIDLLDDPRSFYDWINDNSLNHLSDKDGAIITDKELMRKMRNALVSLVKEYSLKNESEFLKAMAILNEIMENIPVKLVISQVGGGIKRHIQSYKENEQLIVLVIESFIDTYETYGLERIRQCDHETCILYFLDSSKGGKRRWCDMGTCGNRKKAAKHYHKKLSN
jgi:predicted RNA-binding Zn ribbon-like protein